MPQLKVPKDHSVPAARPKPSVAYGSCLKRRKTPAFNDSCAKHRRFHDHGRKANRADSQLLKWDYKLARTLAASSLPPDAICSVIYDEPDC